MVGDIDRQALEEFSYGVMEAVQERLRVQPMGRENLYIVLNGLAIAIATVIAGVPAWDRGGLLDFVQEAIVMQIKSHLENLQQGPPQ